MAAIHLIGLNALPIKPWSMTTAVGVSRGRGSVLESRSATAGSSWDQGAPAQQGSPILRNVFRTCQRRGDLHVTPTFGEHSLAEKKRLPRSECGEPASLDPHCGRN